MDDEFIEAYKHGIIITCCDGIKRRFYPRIFTYSADYPEKCANLLSFKWTQYLIMCSRIILASIRNLGICPCPRCLIPKSLTHSLGMTRDMSKRLSLARVDDNQRRGSVSTARKLIYERNYAVDSVPIENILKEQSLVPTTVRVYTYTSSCSPSNSVMSHRMLSQTG